MRYLRRAAQRMIKIQLKIIFILLARTHFYLFLIIYTFMELRGYYFHKNIIFSYKLYTLHSIFTIFSFRNFCRHENKYYYVENKTFRVFLFISPYRYTYKYSYQSTRIIWKSFFFRIYGNVHYMLYLWCNFYLIYFFSQFKIKRPSSWCMYDACIFFIWVQRIIK